MAAGQRIIEHMFEMGVDKSSLAPSGDRLDEAALIDRIGHLERIKAAAAAEQARLSMELDAAAREREAAQGVPADRQGRGVAAQIALARQISPHRGSQCLGLARALMTELPHTLAALEQGRISEWRATLIARETACLSAEDRLEVDDILGADRGRLDGMGDRQVAGRAHHEAVRRDVTSVVRRAARAVGDRRVTIRPAPDTMVQLSALLPVAEGVSLYAALTRAADSARAAGDERSRSQHMADTLVERVTGRSVAEPVDLDLRLVITDRALFQGDAEPAHLIGYGPLPSGVARRVARESIDAGRTALKRIFTQPHTGELLAMDARSRRVPDGLADFIDVRDQTCRMPWCDAPIRHHDHIVASSEGGTTSAGNLQGLCERCNYTKELPDWESAVVDLPLQRHAVVTSTPTGHCYASTAPPPPGHVPRGPTWVLTA